jgi:putative ABC transport system permease protein
MHMRQMLLDIGDAFSSLRRRPLRSILSSLGIGIGVTALIAMLSISEGAKQKAMAKIVSLGTDTLRIEDSTVEARSEQSSLVNLSQGLTVSDVDQLKVWLGNHGYLGAYERRDGLIVTAGSRSVNATLMGVTSTWVQAEKLKLDWGRPFDPLDEVAARSYCVVGEEISRELNLKSGSTLKIDDFAATVIGSLQKRGSLLTEGTGLSALDFDRTVILPITAMPVNRSVYGRQLLNGMVLTLKDSSEQNVVQAAEQVHQMLLRNHRGVKDFKIVVPVSLLREARDSQRMFSLVMGAIAGLSLLVGGIGVMNVMLANISEQTREIGLRMALGASGARIIWLYLCNSMLLTLSGGVWGTLGGVLLAYGIQQYAGWDVAFSSTALIIAPLSAMVTGLLFGLHPAMRAAALDPAVALRES